MRDIYWIQGKVCPPHLITGNKSRFTTTWDLLKIFFFWNDHEERIGWESMPYRMIFQKTFKLIKLRLGRRCAQDWSDQFLYLIQLTHWILPYPNDSSFLASTKTSQRRGLKRQMRWFSAVYKAQKAPPHWSSTEPYTWSNIMAFITRTAFGRTENEDLWDISQLISACSAEGASPEQCRGCWVWGRRFNTKAKRHEPCWEECYPPRLRIVQQIKGRSLEELDDLMDSFSHEASSNIVEDKQGEAIDAVDEVADNEASRSGDLDSLSLASDTSSGSVREPEKW